MRAAFILVLVVGVGLAGFAVYLAKGVFSDYQAALAAERAARADMVPTVPVVVVKETVRYGDRITPDNVRLVKWPENAIPEGAFTKPEDLFPKGEKRFRTALRTMEKDEAVLAVKVTAPGQDAGVGSRLGKGMRAFAIRVDVTSGVSGFLAPGDHVDIYWTGRMNRAGGGRAQEVTKLIESNVQIIAVDQTADLDRAAPTVARTVTVEATPEQVAALTQAVATGKLTLSLVGFGDETVARNIEVDQNKLLGIEDTPVAEAAPEPKVCTVRTRKGAELIETPIPCPTN
ncbi:MAG: Flp pilus assembly protein CpaB [Alphaproteobacteria bacterium]|nr:MAG: Flp pilus assembly protein CpaB [Alphaproteobacteria bacterium]